MLAGIDAKPLAAAMKSLVGFLKKEDGSSLGFLQSGIGARLRSVQSKASDIVNPKDFGAIGDGGLHPLSERYGSLAYAQVDYPFVTSLATQIDWAACTAALMSRPCTLDVRGLDLRVDQSVMLWTGRSVEIEAGSQVRATPDFVGPSVFYSYGDVVNDCIGVGISGFGTIHGGGVVPTGWEVRCGRSLRIENIKIEGVTRKGLHFGDPAATQATIEVEVSKVTAVLSGTGMNHVDSIGLHFDNCTDSHAYLPIMTGFRTGVQTEKGPIYLTEAHCWTTGTYGPMTRAFWIKGGNNFLNDCYADSPTSLGFPGMGDVIGFDLAGYNAKVSNPRVFLNDDFCLDNEIVGINVSTPDGLYGTIDSPHFVRSGGSTKRFKANFGGSYRNNTHRFGVTQNSAAYAGESRNVLLATQLLKPSGVGVSVVEVSPVDAGDGGSILDINPRPDGASGSFSYLTTSLLRVGRNINTTSELSGVVVTNFDGSAGEKHALWAKLGAHLSVQSDASTLWTAENAIRFGTQARLWVDAQYRLRIKNGAALNDLDAASLLLAVVSSGATANRPITVTRGDSYWDSSLNKPIWASNSSVGGTPAVTWRDADGNVV